MVNYYSRKFSPENKLLVKMKPKKQNLIPDIRKYFHRYYAFPKQFDTGKHIVLYP